jgi:hypothetical protein
MPNYKDLGLSSSMGPQLRTFVERQLLADLTNYGISSNNLKFDWSDSCIEGHDTTYLDGKLENFSGIALYDAENNLVAEGWMDFIHEGDFFLAYWDYLSIWQVDKKIFDKNKPGIPDHVWRQLPDDIRLNYKKMQ